MPLLRPTPAAAGNRAAGFLGRVMVTLFAGIFVAAGAFMFWFMATGFLSDFATWRWSPAECVIVTSAMEVDAQAVREGKVSTYRFVTTYRYEAGGESRTGDRLTRTPSNFSHIADVNRLLQHYPPGARVTGYADPADPSRSALQRPSPLTTFSLLFPLVFVAVGGGLIYATWRGPAPPKTVGQPGRSAKAVTTVVSSILFVIGASLTYLLVIHPAYQMIEARWWTKVPCHVLSSRVVRHPSRRRSTYSIDIRYAYQVEGREYQSDRYSFINVTTSALRAKQDVVQQYPPGSERVCLVDPGDPSSAVLDPSADATMWVGLLPGFLMIVGGTGLFFSLRTLRGGGWKAPSYRVG